jgi:hypothetical protein
VPIRSASSWRSRLLDHEHLPTRLITELVPGRWDEVRGPSELEMKQTSVLALPLDDGRVASGAAPFELSRFAQR